MPDWLRPLAQAVAADRWPDLARAPLPTDGGGRESAVLILLAAAVDGPGVLLIERAARMRSHAGQVAFPGGATDPDDAGPVATALREAAEEVGVEPASVDVLASLPKLFLPPSGFLVTPVLAHWRAPHPVGVVDAGEVARVAVVPIAELVEPANRFVVTHPSGYTGPGFEAGGLFVWGFTAGLLDAVLRMGGWERTWDRTRLRALPDDALLRARPDDARLRALPDDALLRALPDDALLRALPDDAPGPVGDPGTVEP